jgi:hypothetical protein
LRVPAQYYGKICDNTKSERRFPWNFSPKKAETVKSMHAREEDSFAIALLVKAVKKSNRIKTEAAS